MEDLPKAKETVWCESAFKTYLLTPTSFIKREIHHSQRKKNMKGEWMILPWQEERLQNEAAALALIAERTTIPVPRVLSCGRNEDGLAYLEMERLNGIPCYQVGNKCRMPKDRAHNDSGQCSACQDIAMANADRFVVNEILPQLNALRSSTTGLNGFVIPPPWVLEYDRRSRWIPKTSDKMDYVFCHGDLTGHNIMVHPQTLEVLVVYDWEHAGYFPPDFQLWRCSRDEYFDLYRDKDRICRLVALIEA